MTRIPSISACMYQPELFSSLATAELERLQLRYPYFADIPALLAKKYQLEGDMRANAQLVRAALYSSDRALLMKWMTMVLVEASAEATLSPSAPVTTAAVEEAPQSTSIATSTDEPILLETKVVTAPSAAPPQVLTAAFVEAPVEEVQPEIIPAPAAITIEPDIENTKVEAPIEKPKKKRGPKKPGHDIDWEALYEDAKKPHSQDARLKALDDELDALIRSAASLAASDREAYFSDEYVEMDIDSEEVIDLSFFKKDKEKENKEKASVKSVEETPSKAPKQLKSHSPADSEEKKSQENMSNEVKQEQGSENQESKSGFLSFLKQHSKGSAIGQNRARTHASQLRKVMDEFVQSFEDAASGVDNPQVDVLEMSVYGLQEHDDFITETMAEMLVKQEKYDRAIAAFEKLRLLKPEKSVFFATRISEIKNKLNQS